MHFTLTAPTSLFVDYHFPISHRYNINCHEFCMDLNHCHIYQGSIALLIKLHHQLIAISLLPSNATDKWLHKKNSLQFHQSTLNTIYCHKFCMDLNCHDVYQCNIALSIELYHWSIAVSLLPSNISHECYHKEIDTSSHHFGKFTIIASVHAQSPPHSFPIF